MNRAELAEMLADTLTLTKTQAAQIIDAVFANVSQALARGETVRLVGFGTFALGERRAVTGRNPATGERLEVAASRVVRFRPGAALKAAVNRDA